MFDKDPDSSTVDTVLLVVDDMLRPRHVYPVDYVPPKSRASVPPQMAPLPDGRKVFRPKLGALDPTTFEDWVAHTGAVAAPRDLTTRLPIEWLSDSDWEALAAGPGGKRGSVWPAFRRRFPDAWGRVQLSDVGFSASHDEALLEESHEDEGCYAVSWLLLRREEGRWAVVERRRTLIACGIFPAPNVTAPDDGTPPDNR